MATDGKLIEALRRGNSLMHSRAATRIAELEAEVDRLTKPRTFIEQALAALNRADEELASHGYWSEGSTRKPLWDAEIALKALLGDAR